MVNVANRPYIAMRLAALEFLLRHFPLPSALSLLLYSSAQICESHSLLPNLERGTGFEPATITLEE